MKRFKKLILVADGTRAFFECLETRRDIQIAS